MDGGRIRFFASEVWRSFTRNLLMQITAIGTVAVTIGLLGAFLFSRQTLASIGNDAVRKIEISAFLSDKLSPQDGRKLGRTIAADPRVASVAFVPRAQGLRELSASVRGTIDTSLLTSNPLPDKLRIHAIDPQDVRAIAAKVTKLPGVATVTYGQDAVQKLLIVSKVLARIGIAIVAVLVFTAAIIISNTIRLTVFARRREIAIMQLVGASGTYVRMPFVCEGLIAGVLGALVAVGLLALAKFEVLPLIGKELSFVPLPAGSSSDVMLALELVGVGALVGSAAAWLSVSRYLRA